MIVTVFRVVDEAGNLYVVIGSTKYFQGYVSVKNVAEKNVRDIWGNDAGEGSVTIGDIDEQITFGRKGSNSKTKLGADILTILARSTLTVREHRLGLHFDTGID